ncbi:ribonuclease H-like domain-containing protein [Tanacetum coccineum]
MTYLKHVGNKKHSDLKNKTFEDIQALYEKVKRFDESFTVVGSTKDERRIKEMNEGVKDPDQKSLKKRVVEETPKKEDTAKVLAKVDVTEQGTKKRKGGHMKMLDRKKKRPQSYVDNSAYTISIHSQCFSIVNLYLYKLAITLSRLQRSVQFGTHSGIRAYDIPPPPPPSQTPTQQTPQTVSTIKLPILKKGEYDIWAMKMEHYLAHTDYPIWEVIQNGNGPVSITTDTQGQIKVLPPRTAEEILARERERKARTTLLMALPEDHLAKFHKMTDAKEMFQSLLSQLEIHGAGISTEDANQKFLRSLPSAWSQVSLIMRTKPGVDSLSFDDLYNNLRVFENDVKGSTASSSSTQNVAFVSENTSSTNDVSIAYGVSNPSGQNSQYEHTSSYSLLANQSSCPQLDHEDLEQLDEFDLEEMDLKWQVAMISMRMKKFYKKTGRKLQFDAKEPVGFDKTKVECYSCHKTGHFARECRSKGNQDSRRRDAWNSGNKDGRRSGKQEDSKALVTIDGEGVDWTSHSEEEEDYDRDASIEIQAYTQALKKVEAQLVAHQQSQLWYEEKIRFMKIDLDDKTDVLTYHKKLLAEAEKEKEDLKAKIEKWHNSSKNLSILLNSQMSANDKFGLGYGDYRYDGILSYENEVLQSVFMNKESDLENQPLYDRFVTAEGMHVVPPPMTGNYMPSGPDIEIDYSQFTYGPKQSQASESETQTSDFDTCDSNCSDETHESLPEPAVNEPKVVSQPKVWSDAPIIEEYESDSEDEHVSLPTEEQETPSFANKQVKTPRETVKNQFTHSKNPKVDKKGLGYGFTTKACFVCGSLSHLIRDCDFHEKRMAKQAELNNRMRKKSSQREIRPIWNNVQRMNHRNQFVPKAVLTRTGKIPVNTARASSTNNVSTARHNFNKHAIPTNAAIKVNTVKPIVNRVRPKTVFHNTYSPFTRPFNNTTAIRTNFSKQKVNTDEVNAVSAVGGKGKLLHMTGNKAYLAEYQDFHGGPVAFGGSKGYITGKENIVPFGGLACLIAKAIIDESNKWHRRLGHVNFKNLNKLVKGNLVRGLPSKIFQNDHTCVACQKGKQHKASCKAKSVSSISQPLQLLHMDLFGPTSVRSLNHKTYCLVITDDFSRDFIEFCGSKGIKREYSNAGTPQQNRVAERKNSTLIEASRMMLADSFLPNTFWAEAVSTACYVLNRVLVTKPQNKTPYELITEIPALEEIYDNPTDAIFTNSSYDDEGAVDDFTNLERVVNVSPIATLRINSIHPSTLILRDPQSAVQTRSKVTKSSGAHAFDKYVVEILKKFDFVSVKTASTPIETQKPLVKDEKASDVDVHLYDPVIGSLNVYKANQMGLWHPRVSSFDLEAYLDSNLLEQILTADLLTKVFDVSRFQFLVVTIGMINSESLGRALDGTEALLLPKLFILWLAKVSTDSAKLIPLGKDSTAIETLKKIPPRV